MRTLTVSLENLLGTAIEDAEVVVELRDPDHTGTATIVISKTSGSTDANGDVTFSLVPNVLGSQDRRYRAYATKANERLFEVVEFQMPDADSNLHDLIDAAAVASLRSAFLDATQTWTGVNTFEGATVFTGGVILPAGENTFSDAEQAKLAGIEALADVTDAANVDAAGAVMETDYDAQSLLVAIVDNVPQPVVVAASTFVGRKATGDLGTMTATEAKAVLQLGTGDNVQFANLILTGNLTVMGTTTQVDSTVVTIDDPVFTLGGDTAPTVDDNKDRGIEFRWHDGVAARVGFFGYDDSASEFTFIPQAVNTSEVFSGARGAVRFGDIRSTTGVIGDVAVNNDFYSADVPAWNDGSAHTFAVLDQVQTFTARQVILKEGAVTPGPSSAELVLSGGTPQLVLDANSSEVDAKLWDILGSVNELKIRLLNDANTVGVNSFVIKRSGLVVTSVSFPEGNFGVGTATPAGKFDVVKPGSGASSKGAVFRDSTNPTFAPNADNLLTVRGAGSSSATWRGRITAGGDAVAFLIGEYNSKAWLGAHTAALTAWADLYITPDGGTATYIGNNPGPAATNPVLSVLNSNGRVGVGTKTPTEKLDVEGDIRAAGGMVLSVPATDHTAVGPRTSAFVAADGDIVAMDLLYLNASSKWDEADASAAATAAGPLALALAAGTLDAALLVALSGSFVRDDTWAWTPGAELFMDIATGAITETAPSATGEVVRHIGHAFTADVIWFEPSADYAEVA